MTVKLHPERISPRWDGNTQVHDGELTVRRVFTIEYTCRIDRTNNASRCHGWIVFRPNPAEPPVRHPFRKLPEISGIIEQMLADADSLTELKSEDSP